jgi:dihydroflavonol-4-reductase
MKACQKAGVKRVVVTSSVAAIRYVEKSDVPGNNTFDESRWSDPNCSTISTYSKSKTLAERAAWSFVEMHKELELVVINPALIMGPAWQTNDFASGQVVNGLLHPKGDKLPRLLFGIVDVRDVAAAHVKGIEVDEAKGRRFLCVGSTLWRSEMAQALKDEFETKGFPRIVTEMADEEPQGVFYDTSASKTVLGIEYRSPT